MSSDDEFDNDSELLNTLAQFHGLVLTPRLSTERNHNDQNNKIITTFNHDKTEEQAPLSCVSLSSLTSSGLFYDNDSHNVDIIIDSDESSSLTASTHEINNSMLSSDQQILDDLQIKPINTDEYLQSTTIKTIDDSQSNISKDLSMPHYQCISNENIDNNDLINYLQWIINHLNDPIQSTNTLDAFRNLENITLDNQINSQVVNIIHSNSFSDNEFHHMQHIDEIKPLESSIDIDIKKLVEKLVSNTIESVSDEMDILKDLTEHLIEHVISQAIVEVTRINEELVEPFDRSNNISTTSNSESHIQNSILSLLLISPFDSPMTTNDLMTCSVIASVRNNITDDTSNLIKVNYFYHYDK